MACLWNTQKPIQLSFDATKDDALTRIKENSVKNTKANYAIPCIPTGAIFAVLQWSHVHLVALDIETTEPHILVCFSLHYNYIEEIAGTISVENCNSRCVSCEEEHDEHVPRE